MIVSVTDIVAKIKDLPSDYAEHVHLSKPGTAEVTSFTDPTQEIPYSVGIKLAEKKGERDVRCTCPATRLCKHVVAFYAVAKRIKPDGSLEKPKVDKPEKDEAKEKPSEAIAADELQQFAMALREMKATVCAEIAALFNRLAKELQKMKAEMENKK